MKRTAILGVVALTAIVLVGIWMIQRSGALGDTTPESEPDLQPLISSSEADLDSLQEIALASCMCERNGGSEPECRNAYEDEKEKLLGRIYGGRTPVDLLATSATACAPVSTEMDCFEFSDGEECISTSFHVNGASNDFVVKTVCSISEARAIEQAFEEGWLGPNGTEPNPEDAAEFRAANKRANKAVDDMLRRILAGRPIPETSSLGRCVG